MCAVEIANVINSNYFLPKLWGRLRKKHELVPADVIDQYVDGAITILGGSNHRFHLG